jgi:plastocyanin
VEPGRENEKNRMAPSTFDTNTSTRTSTTQAFAVVNSGTTAWSFSGGATGNNPSLTARVNDTLTFSVTAPGHSFAIHVASGQPSGTEWTLGVTGQPTASGTVTFVIPASAPAQLFYQCEIHAAMTGSITISGGSTPAASSHVVATWALVGPLLALILL